MVDGLIQWVLSLPPPMFWVVTGAASLSAGWTAFLSFQAFYRKRLIEDLPTSKIHSAAQGYVELEGNARLMDGPPVIAPLTGLQCVWYRYKIEEKTRHGRDNDWVTVSRGTSDDLFYIEDETGQCVVDPEGAVVTPNDKQTWYGRTRQPPPPQPSTLGAVGKLVQVSVGDRYRYSEQRLNIGAPLHVTGLFRSVGGAGEYYDINADMKELLAEWKRDSQHLLNQFDHNKDGMIDLEEWQQVREAAYVEVLKRHRDEKITLPTHMIEQTRDRRRPFLISGKAQSDFLVDLQRHTWLYATGSGLLMVVTIFLLHYRLGW